MNRHLVELPWPPSSLSGHAKGFWRDKAEVTAKHRLWAKNATLAVVQGRRGMPATGDIPIRFTFTPPDQRGDRTNFPNRLKPYIDGIADALRVNDSRFLPSYVFRPASAPGGVTVEIGDIDAEVTAL